ncbi:hypothetical protein [Paenibacillus sp. RU4T]|nr:hypothetical protein [Paenibacillus sp. RU4T]
MPWEFAALTARQKGALIGMVRARLEAEKRSRLQSSAGSRRR